MRAFVTGGSGFIGQVLIRRLLGEGHAVTALVRGDDSAAAVSALGAQPVRGDLTDPASWRETVAGHDVFFHLAAETNVDASRERQRAVTVDGTRAAVEAARLAGVARFVLCGSEAALLAGEPLVDVDETAPLRPDSPAAYSAAKAEAEQIVLDANTPQFATVSIRPRFVWGPGSILVESLVSAVHAGRFAWPDGSHQRTDVTYVDNAVEGLLLGWHHGRPGQAYFVTDRHPVVLREFLGTLFSIYGAQEPIPDVPAGDVPVPSRWFLGQTCLLKTGKAVAELGYAPVVSHADGFEAVRRGAAASTTLHTRTGL